MCFSKGWWNSRQFGRSTISTPHFAPKRKLCDGARPVAGPPNIPTDAESVPDMDLPNRLPDSDFGIFWPGQVAFRTNLEDLGRG